MALTIRMKRAGRKNLKLWRIVVVDSRKPRDGRSLEEIGTYDPSKNPPAVAIQKDRYTEWVGKGAKPSDTVRTLVKKLKD